MQNEFEKQVQQKMEELKLVPSEPVWQKVEMHIRKKKGRRRFILWIPLLALLLGGSLWLGIDQYSKTSVANKANIEKANYKTQKQNSITTHGQTVTETSAKNEETKLKEVTQNTIHRSKTNSNTEPSFNLPLARKNPSERNSEKRNPFATTGKKSSVANEPTVFAETSNQVFQRPAQKTNKPDSNLTIQQKNDHGNVPVNDIKTDTIAQKNIPVKADTAKIKIPESKKRTVSKWKLNLVVFAGVSGLNRINFYNGQKSFQSPNSYPGSSTGGMVYYGPSEIKKGLSFAIGASMQRQLRKRTFFSTGLQYNYYSNTINVGTVVVQNRVIMDYAVSQYFSNQSVVTQPYSNRYHFISVPLIMSWQLLKKAPLNFNTGLSVQYLIHTNALRFDYSTQSYFHNRRAFNPLQLVWESGLTYSLPLNQKPLVIGPQLQYGFTRLEKANGDHHLLSYGLKVQWLLGKK